MAAPVGPLPQLKLPSGPAPATAEQRYWATFKKQLLVPSPTGYAVTHLSSAGDVLAVTTGSRVQLFSTRTRQLVRTLARFADVARSGEVRADARVLAAGDDGGAVRVLDVASRAVLRTWTRHRQPVWAVRWAARDPTRLLSASDDATVRLWDLAAAEPAATLAGHADYVRCADFMPAAAPATLVSGSYDATVRLWDARVGPAAVMTFRHAAPVEAVLPLPAGTAVAAAAGSAVSVLDIVAARPVHVIQNHQKTVTSLSLASGGRRLVTGGLDGHVKVFETTGWHVVNSTKYQSPVLSVLVTPAATSSSNGAAAAAAAAAAGDRHLAVGMQSGVLSIRTRLSGHEAARDKERDAEMAALLGGRIAAWDAEGSKRKRRIDAANRLDLAGEGADVVIANEPRRAAAERPWQSDLRHGRYARALDAVLDPAARGGPASSLTVLNLLLALRHRSALRDALEGRDEPALRPVFHWIYEHLYDPHCVSVCVEAGLHLVDLYASFADSCPELADAFVKLRRRVARGLEHAQTACELTGMLETLTYAAAP